MGVYPHRWSTVLENTEKEPGKNQALTGFKSMPSRYYLDASAK